MRRLADRCSNSIWDVVIFQVEEDAFARRNQVANNLRTLGGIELHSDFVGLGRVAEAGNNFKSIGGRRDVECDDQPLTSRDHQQSV